MRKRSRESREGGGTALLLHNTTDGETTARALGKVLYCSFVTSTALLDRPHPLPLFLVLSSSSSSRAFLTTRGTSDLR